jgi:hypothetical protein
MELSFTPGHREKLIAAGLLDRNELQIAPTVLARRAREQEQESIAIDVVKNQIANNCTRCEFVRTQIEMAQQEIVPILDKAHYQRAETRYGELYATLYDSVIQIEAARLFLRTIAGMGYIAVGQSEKDIQKIYEDIKRTTIALESNQAQIEATLCDRMAATTLPKSLE